MKIVFFKNESGDDEVPLFELDEEASSFEIEEIVKQRINDDYDKNDDYICGTWWIKEINVPVFSSLKEKK